MEFFDEIDVIHGGDDSLIRFSLKDENASLVLSADHNSIHVIRSKGYEALSRVAAIYENSEEIFREWRKQEKILRHTFPHFDLYAECADPDTGDEFIGYLLCGIDLKTAYETAKMRVVDRYELSSRDRNRRALRRQVDAFAPVMRILMAKYNICDKYDNPVDISKDLLRAISSESADYYNASERGLTVNEYRKLLLRECHERSVEEYIQERAREWEAEARSTKRHYPDFDLQSELDNPETGWRFRRYLDCSAHVTVAYELVHLQTAFMRKKQNMKAEMEKLVTFYEARREQLNQERTVWRREQQAKIDELNRLSLENQEYVATAMEKGEVSLRAKEAEIIDRAERDAEAKFEDKRVNKRRYIKHAIVVFSILLFIGYLFVSAWADEKYWVGFKAGSESGQSSGYAAGYKDGRNNGYEDGRSAWYSFTPPSPTTHPTPATHAESGMERDSPYVESNYIGNIESKRFHVRSCSYLPDSINQVAFEFRSDALDSGYDPCQHCNP